MTNEKRPQNLPEIEKIKTPFAQMIARKSSLTDALYYEILYYDPKDEQTHIGWGSYNSEFVLGWLAKYFEIDRSHGYSLKVVPFCGDCKYKGKKPTKCSCCRRNLYAKDCYEGGGMSCTDK